MSIPEGGIYNDEVRAAGEIAEHLPDEHIASFAAEGDIAFGAGVARGTDPAGVKTIGAATEELLGAAALSFEATNLDDEAYADGDPVGVVRKGVVVVPVEEAVKPGDPVRIRHTADTGKPAGVFCTTAQAAHTARVEHAEFRGATAGAGKAALWISGPLKITADV